MHWGTWDSMQDWWWVMALGMTIFWGLVIWAVVRVMSDRREQSPDDILRRRLAAGEITDDEYQRLRSMLRG